MGKSDRQRRSIDLLELWLCLFPAVFLLFPGFSAYSGISMAKTWTFFVFMGLLPVCGGIRQWQELRQGVRFRPLTGSQIAALAFLGCTLLSAACSPYGALAWYNEQSHEAALTVSLYVLLFLAVSRWGRVTKPILRAAFATLCVFCLICVLQVMGGNPLGLYPAGLNYYDGLVRFHSPFAGTVGNVDLVSAFLALATPLVAVPLLGKSLRRSWHLCLIAGLCAGLLVWLRVLCGIVGLAGGGAVCALLLAPKKWRRPLWIAAAVLLLSALLLLWAWDPPVGFFHELHEILHGRWQDSFGSGRIYIWRQILSRIPERLLLGIGPDAVRFSGLQEFVRYDEAGNIVAIAAITDAHCYPLQILYCQGLPALLAWLAMLAQVCVHWLRRREDRAVAALGCAVTCFLAAMLFCFSSIIIMPLFWLALGLLEAEATRPSEPADKPAAAVGGGEKPRTNSRQMRRGRR